MHGPGGVNFILPAAMSLYILVEGQEDVIMYQLAAQSIGIGIHGNFFGWGAGGVPKIPFVLQLL